MFHLLLAIIYVAFISLGLPDSILGAAWPAMYPAFDVPVSYAGIISMIISFCTVLSSLQSDRLNRLMGTGKVTAVSVAMTAAALLGFSLSHSFWMLCLWAIPYGFGAGGVDTALNNYVALHYSNRHMNWLHCMWGVGAATGPYIMGYALSTSHGWNAGYLAISILQIVLTVILFASLPLWKRQSVRPDARDSQKSGAILTLRQIVKIPGVPDAMAVLFSYCGMEHTIGLWCSSYLVLHQGIPAQAAAGMVGLFYIGITVGRGISGFAAARLSNTQLVRYGQSLVLVGLLVVLLSSGMLTCYCGLILIGLGCGPINPCVQHATPERFGADCSQAIIGVQMASVHIGVCLVPPGFGLIANHISASLLPVYLLVLWLLMVAMHERLIRKTKSV